jgi:hypothetical protein
MASAPPPLDLSALIEHLTQTQAPSGSPGASAGTGVAAAAGTTGLDTTGVISPGPTLLLGATSSFFTPTNVGGPDVGVLGESLGGGGIPPSSGVLYSIFLLSPEIMGSLCLGVVAGSKFCLAGKNTCTIQSHRKKADVKQGMLYIAGPRGSAFSRIFLNPQLLPQLQLEQMLGERYPLEVWRRLFSTIQEHSGGVGNLSSDEFNSVKSRALNATPISLTPRKQQSRYMEPAEEDAGLWGEETNIINKMSPLGTASMEDVDSTSLLTAQVDRLLQANKESIAKFEKLRHAVGTDVDKLEVAIQDLNLKIGNDPGVGDTPMLSVWDGIAFVNSSIQDNVQKAMDLHDELSRIRSRVHDLEAKETQRLSELASTTTRFSQIDDVIRLLVSANNRLTAQVQATLQSHVTPSGSVSVTLDPRFSAMEQAMQAMETRLMRTETMAQAIASAHPSGGVPPNVGDLRLLQEKLRTLEARVSSTPITVAGRTFLSLPDVEAWVVRNAPAGIFYYYHDAISLLELLNSADMMRADVLQELYQAHKVGLKAEAEARMIASFRITVPAIFSGLQNKDAAPGVSSAKPFAACKTYSQWNSNDGYNGLKHFIERGLVDIRNSLKYDIHTTLDAFPEARSFANDLHGLAHTWISELCGWLDSFYLELKQISGCTTEEAWDLVTKCGKRVFEELRRARNMAANANTEPDAIKKTAKYLYAVLQAHVVMAEFVERGFRDHKSIFPVINFHLFQSTAARATVDNFIKEVRNEVKKIDVRCNQIDSLQAKLQKLSGGNPSTTTPSLKKGIKGGGKVVEGSPE